MTILGYHVFNGREWLADDERTWTAHYHESASFTNAKLAQDIGVRQAEERRKAWREHPPKGATKRERKLDWNVPKGGIEPAGRALLKEQERERARAKAERFALLKEKAETLRRQRMPQKGE